MEETLDREFKNVEETKEYDGKEENTEQDGVLHEDLREEFKEIDINDCQTQSEAEEEMDKVSVEHVSEGSSDLPSQNSVTYPGSLNVTNNNRKIGFFKEWSRSRITYTRQFLSESLGYGTKTVDNEIENQISFLNESKNLCTVLIAKAKVVLQHMSAMNAAHKVFGQVLCEHSFKDPSAYKDELICNGEMHQHLHKHTETYERVLRMFISNLATLNDKTLDDLMLSVRQYEACRVEYDAYRVEYEEAQKSNNETTIRETRGKYEEHLSKFNQRRSDLLVKVKLFKDNKDKVIKRNLNVLQDSLCKFSTELSASITETASHYQFKDTSDHSWLEGHD